VGSEWFPDRLRVGSGSAPGGLRIGSGWAPGRLVSGRVRSGTGYCSAEPSILISETYKNKARDGTISDLQRLYSIQVSQNWRTKVYFFLVGACVRISER
jgi:hypothetical protein